MTQRLRVENTATYGEYYDLMHRDNIIGIFRYIYDEVTFPNMKDIFLATCSEYYFNYAKRLLSNQYMIYLEKDDDMDKCNLFLGSMIKKRFANRWKRMYTTLMEKYNALNNITYDKNITTVENGSETVNNDLTINKTQEKTNNNTTTQDNTMSSQTDQITTTTEGVNESTYGFNSVSAVPADTTSTESTNHISGDLDKNKTIENNSEVINGTEKITNTDTHSDFKDSEHEKTLNIDELYSGNNIPKQELLEKEIMINVKYDIVKLILNDVTKVTTLYIY